MKAETRVGNAILTAFCGLTTGLMGCARSVTVPVFTGTNRTVVAEAADVPVKEGAMPKDWKEFPFVDANPAPLLHAEESRDGFLVYSRPINSPIYRETRPQPVERISSLAAFATPGERAQFNFAVYAATDLTGLSAEAVTPFPAEFRQVTYAPFRYVRYTEKGRYRVGPAYLVPVARAPLMERENRRYVLTMRVPDDAVPGLYRGTIRVSHAASGAPREIPYELRVLPFRLVRDPKKVYSAYVSNRYDMKRYVEYGHTTLPTLQLLWREKDDAFFVHDFESQMSAWRAAGGQEPTRLIALAGGISMLYKSIMGKWPVKRPQTDMPPDSFFERLERGLKAFATEWKAKGLPEIYVIGADEPEPGNMAYVTRVFKALHDAGIKTYVTSWSPNPSVKAALKPYVDVWCDMVFEDATRLAASGKREHWCYPNHSAYEIKDAYVQARGGRMTYGFGFWKAADTVLVPWAWSWHGARNAAAPKAIPQLADGMQVLKPDGTEWMEWFWEAFYAGMVDESYVYTLETAVARREGSSDPAVRKAVAEARACLAELRAAIPFCEKYLDVNHWRDDDFDSARMRLADRILRLQEFPEATTALPPSVLPELAAADSAPRTGGFVAELDRAGLLRRKAVPPKDFINVEPGCRVTRTGSTTVKAVIDIDREHGNVNGYKCTSPSVRATFDGGVDYNEYGFVSYKLRVKSNRVADEAARWPHCLLIYVKDANGRPKHKSLETKTDLAADEWHEVLLPLGGLPFTAEERRRGSHMLFYFEERDYSTGDRLELEIRDLELIGAKAPLVTDLEAHSCRRGADACRWSVRLLGFHEGSAVRTRASVFTRSGAYVSSEDAEIASANQSFATRIPKTLPPGAYVLKLELTDGTRVYQTRTADFEIVGF